MTAASRVFSEWLSPRVVLHSLPSLQSASCVPYVGRCIARMLHANPSCTTWRALHVALVNGSSHTTVDLLIGSCPLLSTRRRHEFASALARFFSDCCLDGYKGPLRPPEGTEGSHLVNRAIRKLRAHEAHNYERKSASTVRRSKARGHG